MTSASRTELLTTLRALLERAEDGDVETIAMCVASKTEGLTAALVGEDQPCPVVHAMALAVMARACELVDEANGDDVLPALPDGPGDRGDGGAN